MVPLPKLDQKSSTRGKKYLKVMLEIDRAKYYPLPEAIALVKKTSYSAFDGTVEAHLMLTEKNVRQPLTLPHGSGKTAKVAVFASGKAAQEAKEAGATYVGQEDLIQKIAAGWLDFDATIATPEMMPKVATVAKFLGPKGLMPNPKSGTITTNPAPLVREIKEGRMELRCEPNAPLAHIPVGKISFSQDQLAANITALVGALGSQRIKKLTLAPTMGPGVKVDISTTIP